MPLQTPHKIACGSMSTLHCDHHVNLTCDAVTADGDYLCIDIFMQLAISHYNPVRVSFM